MASTMAELRSLVYRTAHLRPSMHPDDYTRSVIAKARHIFNQGLPMWPWFTTNRSRIVAEAGGTYDFLTDVAAMIIAHLAANPDCSINDASALALKELTAQLRSQWDYRRPPQIPIDSLLQHPAYTVDDEGEPLNLDSFPDYLKPLVADIAAGSTIKDAAANNGVSHHTAYSWIRRFRASHATAS